MPTNPYDHLVVCLRSIAWRLDGFKKLANFDPAMAIQSVRNMFAIIEAVEKAARELPDTPLVREAKELLALGADEIRSAYSLTVLKPGPIRDDGTRVIPISDDQLVSEIGDYVSRATRRCGDDLAKLAARMACERAPLQPLSPTASKVYDILTGQKPYEAMIVPRILDTLSREHNLHIDESNLRGRIKKELLPYGLVTKARIGWRIEKQ